MKILILFIIQILMVNVSFAKIVARVSEIKGDAFIFESTLNSKALKYGDAIEENSEIMVDDSSYMTLVDEMDNIYHVSGGSHLYATKTGVSIKNGKVWVKGNGKKTSVLEALHSQVHFKEGQFIVDTDNLADKTQVMVMTGNINFFNPLEPTLITKVDSGQFSFVSSKYKNGIPRPATRIGMDSYKTMKLAFSNMDSIRKKTKNLLPLEGKAKAQTIVSNKKTTKKKMGKLIFYKSSSEPKRAIASISALEYYNRVKSTKKTIKKKKTVPSVKRIKVDKIIVKQFGADVPEYDIAYSYANRPIVVKNIYVPSVKKKVSSEGKVTMTYYNGAADAYTLESVKKMKTNTNTLITPEVTTLSDEKIRDLDAIKEKIMEARVKSKVEKDIRSELALELRPRIEKEIEAKYVAHALARKIKVEQEALELKKKKEERLKLVAEIRREVMNEQKRGTRLQRMPASKKQVQSQRVNPLVREIERINLD